LDNSAYHSVGASLGPVSDVHFNLSEVADYPGAMPVLVEALEKKGVRFDESSFCDGEVTYLNQNVVVLRGAAYEFVHRAFHREEHGLAGKKTWKRELRFAQLLRLIYACGEIVDMAHSRGGSNETEISCGEPGATSHGTKDVDGRNSERRSQACSPSASSIG